MYVGAYNLCTTSVSGLVPQAAQPLRWGAIHKIRGEQAVTLLLLMLHKSFELQSQGQAT